MRHRVYSLQAELKFSYKASALDVLCPISLSELFRGRLKRSNSSFLSENLQYSHNYVNIFFFKSNIFLTNNKL